MANGPGVSIGELGDGRWRVRWREDEIDESTGERRRVQRERVVRDHATAIDLQAKLVRAIERADGVPSEAVPSAAIGSPARRVARVATVDEVFAGWFRARSAKGVARTTLENYGGQIARVLRTWRTLHSLRETEAVPGSALTRDGVNTLILRMRADGYSEGTVYGTIGSLLSAWSWASDDPTAYPGIAPAPRDPKALKPRAPVYVAGPAPTMAECDAVIRRLAAMPKAANIALPVAVIARFTGLRLGQILAIRCADVVLPAAQLTVVKGKGRRETAERRTVPISPHLVAFLAPYVTRAEREGRGLLLRRSDVGRARKGETDRGEAFRGGPDRTLRKVWEAATVAGEVRREVWAPENRKQARPDHAFRAALQGHLVAEGVRDETIDLLVGHAGGLRGRHYVDAAARLPAMTEAVAKIPAIDWGETAKESNVVNLDARR